jgi:hypothetical protein
MSRSVWGVVGVVVLLAITGLAFAQYRAAGRARADLNAEVARLTAANGDLGKALDTYRKAHPDAAPIAAVSAQTPAVLAHGPALPRGATPPAPPEPPQPPALGAVPTPTTPPACLVAEGTPLRFKVDAVALDAGGGRTDAVGTVELYRLDLGGPVHIAGAPWQAPVKLALPRPGWGFGVAGFATLRGLAPGVGVLTPPLHVLGLDVEAVALVGFGVDGPHVAALVGVRS